MAEPQDQSSHIDTKTLRMVQAMQQSVRYAEAARRAEAADARSQKALELRTAETASKGAARALRGELQQDANALAHDKYRYQIFQGFLKRYDDAVKALAEDDKARIAHDRTEQQIAINQSSMERATVGRDRGTASDFKSQIETYSAAAIPAAQAATQSGTFDVNVYNRELRRRLTGPKAPGGGWVGYQSAIGAKNGNPALEPALRAYAHDPTPENLKQVVAQHVSATTVTDQPGTERASIYQPKPYPDTEAAARARRFIENAEAEYRRGLQAWGVQGAGTPQTPGQPGTPSGPAPVIPESPLVEQILKKAMQEGTMPSQPTGATYDYKTTYGGTAAKPEGAPGLSYIDDNGLRTYTNVPWEVTGEMKPRYMEALKKARPEWAKKPTGGGAAKSPPPAKPSSVAGPPATSPPAKPVSAEPYPLAATVARALSIPFSAIGVPPMAVDAAMEWGPSIFSGASQFLSGDLGPASVAMTSALSGPGPDSAAASLEAEVRKISEQDPVDFARATDAHWAQVARQMNVPEAAMLHAVRNVKAPRRVPVAPAAAREVDGGFNVPPAGW